MRRQPALSPPASDPFASVRDRILIDLTLKVVTPMFGGGAIPGQVDTSFPVNGKSVRGQLRFWWRACKAARYSSTEALFEDEAVFWGDTARKQKGSGIRDTPSDIDVVIEPINIGDSYRPNEVPYALFPFKRQQNRDEQEGRVGVSFRFTLKAAPHVRGSIDSCKYKTLLANAEAAVWAWITFGGVGARTRRGCGSLYCLTDHRDQDTEQLGRFRPPSTQGDDVKEWLVRNAGQHVDGGTYRHRIPLLHDATCVYKAHEPIQNAWSAAVTVLQDFRQKPAFARQPIHDKRPGMSYWPDRATVYELLRLTDPRAGFRPNGTLRGLPRADFGLPILFQNMEDFDRKGPPTLEARGDQATRMASPVITKALPVSEAQAVPILICLNAPHLGAQGVDVPELKISARTQHGRNLNEDFGNTIVPNRQDIPSHDPSRNLMNRQQASVRDAFMRYAENAWTSSSRCILQGASQ